MFGLRRDIVPRSEVEHRFNRSRRAGRRTGDAALLHDERERGDGDRLKHGADNVQPAVGCKHADDRVPIELHVYGADQKVEAAADFLDRRRVLARYDVTRPDTFGFLELAFVGRDRTFSGVGSLSCLMHCRTATATVPGLIAGLPV